MRRDIEITKSGDVQPKFFVVTRNNDRSTGHRLADIMDRADRLELASNFPEKPVHRIRSGAEHRAVDSRPLLRVPFLPNMPSKLPARAEAVPNVQWPELSFLAGGLLWDIPEMQPGLRSRVYRLGP